MSATDAEIRPARPEEAARLTDVAVASKAYWGYDPAFMERFAAIIAVDPPYTRHDIWVLVHRGEIAGFYRVIHHGDVAELDHLWLLPRYIGLGLGRLLFQHAMGRASDHGARRLEWEAEPNAIGFYRRMGAAPVRETSSELGRRLQVYALDIPVDAAKLTTD